MRSRQTADLTMTLTWFIIRHSADLFIRVHCSTVWRWHERLVAFSLEHERETERERNVDGRRESEREDAGSGLQITLWSAINGDVIATIGEPIAAFTYASVRVYIACRAIARCNKMLEKARAREIARARARTNPTDTKCCRRLEQKTKEQLLFTVTDYYFVYVLRATRTTVL